MKQTAVDWLEKELTLPEYGDNPNWVKVAIQKAKEMEKEQILRAHSNGWNNGTQGNFITPHEYYNETFKKV
jgi:hypothetical protein